MPDQMIQLIREANQGQSLAVNLKPTADTSNNPAVTIGVPALGLHKSVMSISLAALAAHSIMAGVQINLIGHDLSGIARNRNILAKAAVETGSTHILMLDSDMTFPPDLLVRLLAHGKDIVGVPYPRRSPPYELLGRPKYPEAGDQNGLVEMEMLPAGLLLIKTDVFKSIQSPWFWESYKYDGEPVDQLRTVLYDALSAMVPAALLDNMLSATLESQWLAELERQGKPLTQERSEDINFCFKAQRHGFQLWGDLDLLREIGHSGDNIVRVGNVPAGASA